MKLATSHSVDSAGAMAARGGRDRSSGDVNRWVDMIQAELGAEDRCPHKQEAVDVSVEFGRAAVDLTTRPLNAGDCLQLDQLADEPLDIVVAGRTIARGELVEVDGQLGVRILELLVLVLAWLIVSPAVALAEERPRPQSSSKLFDGETSEILETPFGSVRSVRSSHTEDPWEDALRASERPTTSTNSSSSSSNRKQPTISDRSESVATPLSPRSKNGTGEADQSKSHGPAGWSTTVWSLLFVVGLITLGARWLKSRSPVPTRGLPSDVFELLGSKPIDQRTSVVLARCGSRLLLLNLSPHGLRTLAEISDPVEADCLAGLCRATPRDQTLADTFRTMLRKSPEPKPMSSTDAGTQRSNLFDGRLATRLMPAQSSSSAASEAHR